MSWAFQPLLPSAVVLTGSTLNSYTLVAEVGSLSLVRNDAALKKAKTLTADVATFTEDLQPATLTVDRTLTASSGTFAFNGNDVTLTKTSAAKTLTADVATFTEDLKPANLLVTRKISADVQTYNEDLKPANLARSRISIFGGSVYRTKTEVDGPALFTDTITQANGTILGDTAEWDRWNTTTVDTINSNGTNAVSTTANRASVGVIVANTTFGPDQWAEHTHQANSGGRWTAGPLVRASSGTTTNGYSFLNAEGNGFTNPSAFRIVKHVNSGTPTTIATSGAEGFGPVANSGTYTMRLEVIGDRLYGYIDGKLIVTGRDSTFTSGQPGFQIIYGGSTISFSAGQIEASTTGLNASRTLSCASATYTEDLKPANLIVARSLTANTTFFRLKTLALQTDFSDNFNRANESLDASANWQPADLEVGSLAIVGNEVTGVDKGNVYSSALANNQWAEILFTPPFSTGTGKGAGILLRATGGLSTFTGYSISIERDNDAPGDLLRIRRHLLDSTFSDLFNAGLILSSVRIPEISTPPTKVKLRAEIYGDTIYAYVNDILWLTATNNTIPSGKAGIWVDSSPIDDFSCGSFTDTLSLKASRTLSCATATYNETLRDANLLYGRKVVAATGGIRLETNIATAVFSDDFNRANAATLGANWSLIQGAFAITSNKVYSNITDFQSFAAPINSFSSNHGAKITVSGDFNDYSDFAGVGVRVSSGTVADYRTWTELDPTSVISKVPNTVSITSMNATSGTGVHGVWYDGGTNWKTGDFWTSVGPVTVTSGGENSRFIIAGLTNSNTTGADSASENRPSIQVRWVGTTTTPKIELVQYRSTDNLTSSPIVSDFYQGSAVAVNTPFYIEFERVGSVANCRIYSDASHLTLVDTLTINLTEVISIQYYYVAGKSSTGSSATVTASIGATNFDTPATGYVLRGDGFPATNRTLFRYSYGNYVSIGAPAIPLADGDTIEVTAIGSNISAYVNNILKYSVTDTLYSSGKPAINYNWGNTRDVFIDDFYSWNISGSADLKASRTLSCATATYNEDLKAANLLVGRKLTSDTQTYTLTLKDATLTKTTTARTITADVQSYTLTGGQANLVVGRKLTSDTSTYTFTPQPANLVTGRKLSAEEFRANYLRNSTLVGTVAGTPGTAPTLWFTNTPAAWATRTIVGTGLDPTTGLTYIDVSYSGTNNTGSIGSIIFDPIATTVQVAQIGQTWTSSSYFGLVAGTWPTNANILTVARNASSVGVGNSTVSIKSISSSTLQRFTATHTISNSTAVYIQTAIRFDVSNGETANFTVRIAAPQLERGAAATAFIPTSSGPNYKWFELVGIPTNLKIGRSIFCSTSLYSLTSVDVAPKVGRKVTADKQTYTFNGNNANLKATRTLLASTQSYNEDLKPANLKVGKRLVADRRIYSISTSETTFRLGRRITADKQTYVLTGIVASFKTAGNLIADVRSYTLTGNPAGTLRFAKLSAAATSYTFTGNAASLIRGKKVVAETASYNETLQDATLRVTRKVTADTRSYSFNGQATNLSKGFRLFADTCSYSLTGNDANLARGKKLVANVSSYNLSGQSANLRVGRKLTGDVRSYALSTNAANLLEFKRLVADVRTYTLSGQSANLLENSRLVAESRAYTLTRNDATLKVTRRLVADTRSYALTGNNFFFGTAGKITADTRSYAFTGNAANLVRSRILISSSQSYNLVRNDAALKSSKRIIADKATYILTGRTANILAGERGPSDSRNFILTGNPANLTVTRKLISAVSLYTLTGNDANLKSGRKVSLSLSSYVTSGTAANLLANRKIQLVRTFFDTNGYVEPGYTDPNYVSIDIGMRAARKLAAQVTSFNLNGIAININRGGFIKVWNGSAWVSKPLKVWNGTAWVSKSLKVWTGTIWRTY